MTGLKHNTQMRHLHEVPMFQISRSSVRVYFIYVERWSPERNCSTSDDDVAMLNKKKKAQQLPPHQCKLSAVFLQLYI